MRLPAVKFDVSDEKAVKSLVAQTIERFGQIDILVNNAALYSTLKPRNFNEWDADLWDRVMAINTRGPFLMVKHVAPHMIERRSGKIINIASGAAYKGVPRMLPYVTSKGAMLAFTRALSRELGQYGIAVNSLSPGYILSDTGLENRDACGGGAHPGAQQPRLQARRLSGRPARRAGVPRLERQRFRHRPVAGGGRRRGQ